MFRIIIKQRSRSDIEDFLKDNSDAHTPPLYPRVNLFSFSEKIFNSGIQFWAYSNNSVAGFMACYFNQPSKEIGYITTLSIKPDFQGQGLGKFMTKEAKKFALENSFNRIGLEVNINNNAALCLYTTERFNIVTAGPDNYYMEYKIK